MLKLTAAVFIFGLGIAPLHAAAQDQGPPKELVQYVRDAKAAGLNDEQIRQNAAKAGWPGADVNSAMAYISSTSKQHVKEQSAAKTPEKPKEVPPAAPAVQAATPEKPAAAAASSAAQEDPKNHGVPDDYQIGAGDVVQISVWKEPEASVPSAVVRPDGKISVPLLKEVSVIGLTPTQAEKMITEQLDKFISGANVTVVVTEIHSKKIYAVGAIKKEGPIDYTYRMSVMQAISEAGGLTDYAKRKKIYVLRNENGRQYRLPFDYDSVLRGERMELNIPLVPGDTLVVPH